MRRLATASLALGFLVPAAPSAFAQERVNAGENALDANLQVGSGGTNPRNQTVDYGARNLLITGQVTGGREFRGATGIRAEGAFGGQRGSDDLFRFRADSAIPGGVGASPAQRFAPNNSVSGLGGGNIIFDNYFTPSVGGPQSAPRVVISPDGGTAERVPAGQRIYNPGLLGGPGRGGLTDDLNFDGRLPAGDAQGRADGRRITGDTLGRFAGPDGRALQVDASPLTGVRRSEVLSGAESAEAGAGGLDLRRTTSQAPSAAPVPQARELRLGGSEAPDPASGIPGAPRPATTQARNAGDAGDAASDPVGGLRAGMTEGPRAGALPREPAGRLPGSPDPTADPANGGTDNATASGGFARGGVPLAVQLGSQLNPVLRNTGGAESGTGAGGTQSRLEQLREQIFRPLQGRDDDDGGDGENAEGNDPYIDLLRRLRDGEQGAAAVRPAWMRDLAEVPDEVLNSAEDRRRQSMDRLLQGLRGDGDDRAGAGTDDDAGSEDARSVANQLGYDGPRLETLRGQRKTRINDSLEKAQAALSEGRYFDSESLYRQVVTDSDDQPLARVGLVHAQMAAGMVRSSALSLRSLFNDHPELISARYAEQLLPPADRMAWLRDELQKLIDDPRSPRAEPALMLAYLGRQIESRPLVRYGLALAEEARPADPLFSLLRAAWLGEGAAAGDGAPADAPAVEGK